MKHHEIYYCLDILKEILELRQEIASYIYSSRGVVCTAQQVVFGSGTEQLMPLLIRLLGKQAIYAIENPGYPMTHHIFANNDQKNLTCLCR